HCRGRGPHPAFALARADALRVHAEANLCAGRESPRARPAGLAVPGMTGRVLSINVGGVRPTTHADIGITAIDKRAVTGPVAVRAPGAMGSSAVAGDRIADARHHGGPDQAVYAYAREDLDVWE